MRQSPELSIQGIRPGPYPKRQPNPPVAPQPGPSTTPQPEQSATRSSAINYVERHVVNVIESWAKDNMERIKSAYTQKGGWEGWAQVEIATALQESRDSTSAEVALKGSLTTASREVPVYPTKPSSTGTDREVQPLADVVIESSPRMPRQFVIIELKCEGLQNKSGFVTRVAADVAKLEGVIRDEFKPAKAWALAISTSPKVCVKMREKWPTAKCRPLPQPAQGVLRCGSSEQSPKPEFALWVVQREVFR